MTPIKQTNGNREEKFTKVVKTFKLTRRRHSFGVGDLAQLFCDQRAHLEYHNVKILRRTIQKIS